MSEVLEKGPKTVCVALASFILHPCCDFVSGEGWFPGENPRGEEM